MRTITLALMGTLASAALAQNDLLVADRGADAVFRFDATTGDFIDVFVQPGLSGWDPVDVQVGPDGNVYVVNFNPGTIFRFDGQTGDFIDVFFDSDGDMEEAVAVLFQGEFGYILGNDSENLIVFDAHTGAVLRDIRTPSLRFAHDMAFDDQGFLHAVTENSSVGLVQVWSFLPDIVERTYAPPPQGLLVGIAIQPGGDSFVSDFTNRSIIRFDGSTGAFVEVVAQDDTLFNWITSMQFTSDDTILASTRQGMHEVDINTGEIFNTLIPTGSYGGLTLGDPRGFVIRGNPCPVDIDGDGSLTIFDFLAFQNLFDAGDLQADFDGDGDLTIFDFLEFQNQFDAGCE
jgi:outer membrane protein assembly factor BamB